jgi:hypothetical protein
MKNFLYCPRFSQKTCCLCKEAGLDLEKQVSQQKSLLKKARILKEKQLCFQLLFLCLQLL